jgi:hypothetical protein
MAEALLLLAASVHRAEAAVQKNNLIPLQEIINILL